MVTQLVHPISMHDGLLDCMSHGIHAVPWCNITATQFGTQSPLSDARLPSSSYREQPQQSTKSITRHAPASARKSLSRDSPRSR